MAALLPWPPYNLRLIVQHYQKRGERKRQAREARNCLSLTNFWFVHFVGGQKVEAGKKNRQEEKGGTQKKKKEALPADQYIEIWR